MSRLEKILVNSPAHSEQVAIQTVQRLRFVPIGPSQTYLDVGCGNGAPAVRVAVEHRLNVTGIDCDPNQIQLAKESSQNLPGIRFIVGDATCLPFDDEEFDFVATQKATHHMPNWEAALTEMFRVLKPTGYLIYSDLVAPAWLASVSLRFSKGRHGFATRAGLDRFIEEKRLLVIRRVIRGFSYEAILHRH